MVPLSFTSMLSNDVELDLLDRVDSRSQLLQACVCTSLFDNIYSHRPGAPYGDQRIGINHIKSSKKDQL